MAETKHLANLNRFMGETIEHIGNNARHGPFGHAHATGKAMSEPSHGIVADGDARETIFALSTAPGRSGVAVVRVSGAGAAAALEAFAGVIPPARRARHTRLLDPGTGELVDRGLILWFPGPNSFTGEDVAEFHVHGGVAVIEAMLAGLGRLPGLRPAEPGEFTRRAFLAGKLDLSEVEGLADLIEARTEAQRRQALRQMEGGLSGRCDSWRTRLICAQARLEAMIDFGDEDLHGDPYAEATYQIEELGREISQYIDLPAWGERVREGFYVAVIGPPNAGKSSLVNALARRDVAIVSSQAGTTRDVLEVELDLGGYPVTVADTAGLRAPGDTQVGEIEREGMRRARDRAAGADLKLIVLDGATDLAAAADMAPPDHTAVLELIDGNTVVVLNKSDLLTQPVVPPRLLTEVPVIAVSAKTGAGLETLLARLAAIIDEGVRLVGEAPMTRVRHRLALQACAEALSRALSAQDPELMAEDIRLAGRALGRISGRIDVEDVLDAVFSEFCIGK